jgi:cytochrome c-type biogenesis protein CcmH
LHHWERVLDVVPGESEMVPRIRASIAEAQQLGGIRPAGSQAQSRQSAVARVAGVAKLAPEFAGKVSPTDTVFIFARAAEGPRAPLAVLRKQARDLPVTFVLDDSMAMSPQMRLSSFARVVVGARVSKSANATPQPGDLHGQSAPVKVGAQGIAVTIDTEVR